MSQGPTQRIEQRIVQLEREHVRIARENRVLRRGAALALVGIALVAVVQVVPIRRIAAQSGETTIAAQNFVVRDENGVVRAAFGLDSAGDVQLNLLGGGDALQPGGASPSVQISAGRSQSMIGLHAQADPGSAGVAIIAAPSQPGRLAVRDTSGETIFSVP